VVVLKFIANLLKVGFIALLGTALAAKFLLESHGSSDSEEVDLVAIFDGVDLVSSAEPFYGGKVMAIFGGVLLDLRTATPAPTGIYLDLIVLMGGVSLVVPEGWRVRFEGRTLLSGYSDTTHTTADPDAPTVTVTGTLAFAGLQATTRSPVEAVA
jgi:hypothetical protein